MAFSQQLLEAIANMQQVGQENLPVMPNNGNPGGANNMPQSQPTVQQLPQQTGPMDKYPWMKPSPAVGSLRLLSERIMGGNTQPQPTPQQQAVTKPMQIQPVMPAQTKPMMILPEQRGMVNEQPVMPRGRNPMIRQYEP